MEPDREAASHTGVMSADQLTQALLTSLSSDQSSSMQSGSSSRVATPGSGATITSTSGMSIAVPFSSHDSSLDLPRDQTQSVGYDSLTALSQEEAHGLFSARPLAVKPAYRKRPITIPAKSDGLIRHPGTIAAIAKDLSVGGARVARAKKGKNIYDETETNTQAPPEPPVQNTVATPQPVAPEKPKKTPRPRTKRKRAVAPLVPEQPEEQELMRRRKRIRYKRQIVWRPKTPLTPGMVGDGINRPSGLKRPTRRDHAIELLITKQEQNREKMINMTQKPLILQELQALMDTRIAAEDKALMELGVILHKELLKLQLEEGALLQMMAAVKEGRLDPSDLKRVGPGKERYGLTAVMRKPKRKGKSALTTQGDLADEGTTSMNIDGESTRGNSDADGDENDVEDIEDDGEQDDDDDEQDGEDEEGDEGDDVDEDDESDEDNEEEDDDDDDVDQEDADRSAKMLRTVPDNFYPRLGESYASRPILSDVIGKETAKGRPANTSSKDDIKLVIDRAKKRTQLEDHQKEDWRHQGSDNEDENMEAVEDNGEREEEEEAQNEDFDNTASGEDEDNISEEEEEDEEEEEEEEDDGEDYDDDDEARDALQRMLREYGAPV